MKPDELPGRIHLLSNQLREAEKQIKLLQSKAATSQLDSYLDQVVQVQHVPLLAVHVGELPMDALRQVLDQLRQKITSSVLVVASVNEGNACFAASVSPEWVEKGVHAGKLVGQVAAVADGGGGGKPDKAQAGGKDASKIDLALKQASAYLESVLK